jgi:hypothetical protein
MRLHILVWTLILGFSGGVVAIAAKAPKEVVIKACQKAKPPVAFPHAAHVKLAKSDCKVCHHTGAQKACSSAGCHAGKAEGKRPGCAEMALTKNPFHIRCVGCHKKEKKGPTTCAACHKK